MSVSEIIKADYKVVIGKGFADFEEQVNTSLNLGYIPVGGVFVNIKRGETWLFQAVMRKEETCGGE